MNEWDALSESEKVEWAYKQGFSDGMKEAPTGEDWIRAIDEALVGAHLGIADMGDDYGTAKKKLNALICWSIDVDRELTPKAQAQGELPEPTPATRKCACEFDLHGGLLESCKYHSDQMHAYAAQERDRICAAIKAEDDYCVDKGDYMLDSNDCIAVVRGTWKRPDFSIDTAIGEKQ